MEIFNIGPLELLLIIVIALIVLGPEEMVRTGRKLAKAVNKFIKSPVWKSLVNTSQEIRELPRKFIKEAELDETVNELNKMNRQIHDFAKTDPLETARKTTEYKLKVEQKVIQPAAAESEDQTNTAGKNERPVLSEPAVQEEQSEPEKQNGVLEDTPKIDAA